MEKETDVRVHFVSQSGLREAYTETALKVDRQSAAAFVDVYRFLAANIFLCIIADRVGRT